MSHWHIEQDAAGRGTVRHHAAPRFTAIWTSGEIDLTVIDGLFWQEAGSGSGEDSLILHGFQWTDAPPDQKAFERLMEQAARAIDEWIARRF
ncbi:MAG: hypothetical protein ACXWTP_08445 [Methylosarcina sp.]